MKKTLIKAIVIIAACIIATLGFWMVGCDAESEDPIRIHIRANSNSAEDQAVKLSVRDAVIGYLTPKLKNAASRSDAYSIIEDSIGGITAKADKVLCSYGFSYAAGARLTNEYFPARSYDGVVFDSGYYDALIVELGSGSGDNWWCVAYPPLCFYGNEDVEYSSIIWEWINK